MFTVSCFLCGQNFIKHAFKYVKNVAERPSVSFVEGGAARRGLCNKQTSGKNSPDDARRGGLRE